MTDYVKVSDNPEKPSLKPKGEGKSLTKTN